MLTSLDVGGSGVIFRLYCLHAQQMFVRFSAFRNLFPEITSKNGLRWNCEITKTDSYVCSNKQITDLFIHIIKT